MVVVNDALRGIHADCGNLEIKKRQEADGATKSPSASCFRHRLLVSAGRDEVIR